MDDVDLFVGEPIVSWMLLCLSPLMPAVVSVLGAEGRDLGMNRGNVLQVHLPNFEGLVGSLQGDGVDVLLKSKLVVRSYGRVIFEPNQRFSSDVVPHAVSTSVPA